MKNLLTRKARSRGMSVSSEFLCKALNMAVFALGLAGGTLIAGDASAVLANCQATITSLTTLSFGTGIDPVCQAFEWVNALLTQNTGKALASLAIGILGLMALFGKLRWPTALMCAFGMALMFGAGGLFVPPIDTVYVITGVGGTPVPDPIRDTFNTLFQLMHTNLARGIGILGASTMGIAAMYGRLQWSQALLWIVSIGMMFGAVHLVNILWAPNTVTYTWLGVTTLAGGFGGITGDGLANGPAFDAATPDAIATPFMGLVEWIVLPGSMGSAIAIVMVMALGVAAAFGKISWIRGVLLIMGIALVYGAADVVFILSGAVSPCVQLPAASDPFTRVICGFQDELMGPMGRVIGCLAVMVMGVLAMLGKISWDLGLTMVVGIALVFGAFTVVNLLEYAPGLVNLNDEAVVTCTTATPSAPSTGNAIADVLCYIMRILYGPAGKALACVAVALMGFGAMLGKVSYSQAFIVAIGIAVMYGAPGIVSSILLPQASAGVASCVIPSHGGIAGGATALLGNC